MVMSAGVDIRAAAVHHMEEIIITASSIIIMIRTEEKKQKNPVRKIAILYQNNNGRGLECQPPF